MLKPVFCNLRLTFGALIKHAKLGGTLQQTMLVRTQKIAQNNMDLFLHNNEKFVENPPRKP